MENQASDHKTTIAASVGQDQPEPVRTRWTPKPEQILILESIFNSGMVNPPKEETIRIRKLLEKFGTVRDANVFYWFQNRRSRSRRRQRQLAQASLLTDGSHSVANCNSISSISSFSFNNYNSSGTSCSSAGSSNSSVVRDEGTGDDLFAISRQLGFVESDQSSSNYASSFVSPQLHYHQSGTMMVFINGTALEVPRGPIDLRSFFGQDVMLVHSSGELVPVNEFGFLTKGLQMGESYFLVSM
ncbi:hypothetical protein LUZ60_004023 [Juncus effusus]|nr:hypothetical protein LUZ60_004023 [Juncus effusus]